MDLDRLTVDADLKRQAFNRAAKMASAWLIVFVLSIVIATLSHGAFLLLVMSAVAFVMTCKASISVISTMRELSADNRLFRQPKEFMLNYDKSALALVSIDKSDVNHTFFYGQTRYGAGQEPDGGHKPVTIIEVENDVVVYDSRCEGAFNRAACDSCKSAANLRR